MFTSISSKPLSASHMLVKNKKFSWLVSYDSSMMVLRSTGNRKNFLFPSPIFYGKNYLHPQNSYDEICTEFYEVINGRKISCRHYDLEIGFPLEFLRIFGVILFPYLYCRRYFFVRMQRQYVQSLRFYRFNC